MKPEEYRDFVISTAKRELGQEWQKSEGAVASRAKTAFAEQLWAREQRPYYNIWPIAVELAQSVKLDVAFSDVEPRSKCIVLRFARGHEPCNLLTTALLCWFDDRVFVSCPLMNKWFSSEHDFRPARSESKTGWQMAGIATWRRTLQMKLRISLLMEPGTISWCGCSCLLGF